MKGITTYALLLVAIVFALWFVNTNSEPDSINAGDGASPGPGSPTCSAVTSVDFALGVEARGPILAVTPGASPQTQILQLSHVSNLKTSKNELCKGHDPATTPCADINAFSWGLDWIPLKSGTGGSSYCLDSLLAPAQNDPGWAILYFVRDNEIFGLAWGAELQQQWPTTSNSELILIQNNSYPPISAQDPLHTPKSLDIDNAVFTGIDFNAWVDPIGAGGPNGTQNCFPLPPSKTHLARLYYVPHSTGANDSGQKVWFPGPHPDPNNPDEWAWSPPTLLCKNVINGLPPGAEIESLAFDRRVLTDGSGTGHKHLLVSVAFNDSPWPPYDASQPEWPEGGFFIIPVTGDDGSAVYGDPKPVYIQLDVDPEETPLHTIIGPRSRGTCATDPTLYEPARKVMEASSSKSGK